MSYDQDDEVGGSFKMSDGDEDDMLDMPPDAIDFGEDGEIDPDTEK